ncbi:MAG: dual specificity protein phosphatase family protein [Candidatus Thiodiazotropha sp. L084R]
MAIHPFDILPLNNGGNLIFTPCPGTKGVDLETSVRQLKEAGAESIITLMPTEEMHQYNADSLPQVCKQKGLGWFHLPVEDEAAPGNDFQQIWNEHKTQILQLIEQGGSTAIHCRGGSGRTGLMATILLLARGIEFENAVALVKSLRPNSLKLPAHLEYLTQHLHINS